MNAFKIKEVQELPKSTSDVGKTTKAFENAKNEVRSPRHITTINEGLAGQTYPGTNVEYRKHTFTLNGEKVEGVFPKFDSKFDTMLPRDLRNASDTEQFKYCTQKLAKQIENNPELAKQNSWKLPVWYYITKSTKKSDLAEALGVSRQSISKWETGGSLR